MKNKQSMVWCIATFPKTIYKSIIPVTWLLILIHNYHPQWIIHRGGEKGKLETSCNCDKYPLPPHRNAPKKITDPFFYHNQSPLICTKATNREKKGLEFPLSLFILFREFHQSIFHESLNNALMVESHATLILFFRSGLLIVGFLNQGRGQRGMSFSSLVSRSSFREIWSAGHRDGRVSHPAVHLGGFNPYSQFNSLKCVKRDVFYYVRIHGRIGLRVGKK